MTTTATTTAADLGSALAPLAVAELPRTVHPSGYAVAPVEVEVVLREGRGARLDHDDAVRSRMVVRPGASLEDLLFAALETYRFDDHDHLAKFYVRDDRSAAPQGTYWPVDGNATEYVIRDLGVSPWPGLNTADADRTVSSLLAVGEVGYLWFDFSDDWWFEVRVVSERADVPAGRADEWVVDVCQRPGAAVVQYPGPDGHIAYRIAA